MKDLTLFGGYKNSNNNFPEKKGRQYLSYSTYNSFKEDAYRGEMWATKLLGIKSDGNIFTSFGSAVGEWLESQTDSELLSAEDKKWLEFSEKTDSSIFEREIMIDRGNYVIMGYIDKLELSKNIAEVCDYKTGGDKKVEFYSSPEYEQTTLYCFGLEEEGIKIKDSKVLLYPRKGNTLEANSKNRLRLVAEPISVPTPYTRERGEKFLKEFDKVAKELSEYSKFYLKFFGE